MARSRCSTTDPSRFRFIHLARGAGLKTSPRRASFQLGWSLAPIFWTLVFVGVGLAIVGALKPAWLHLRHADGAASSASGASSGGAGARRAGGRGGPGGFGGPGGKGGPGSDRPQPVSVVAARLQDVRVMASAIGTLTAANTATVRSQVDGVLRSVHFREGQMVKAGELLAKIDPRSFAAVVAQNQGQLARDQAQLRNAQVDLDRYQDLVAQDSAPKQQLDTQSALVKQLDGTVQIDEAQLASAKLQLSYTRITAPISGRAGLRQVDAGNLVHSSDAGGLLTITQSQPIAIVFALPAQNLPRIAAQLHARQPPPVEAWDRDLTHKLADGQLATTDNAIDTATDTIKLKAFFPNLDGTLFPNQFVNVKLQLDRLHQVLAVPTAAVLQGEQGSYVYAVADDRTVHTKLVKTGAAEHDWTSVTGPLAAGDKVVTDGTDRLREGAKVEVVVPAASAPSSGGAARGGRRRRGDGSAPGAAPASTPSSSSSATGAMPRG